VKNKEQQKALSDEFLNRLLDDSLTFEHLCQSHRDGRFGFDAVARGLE
jgi:hypothetical protein